MPSHISLVEPLGPECPSCKQIFAPRALVHEIDDALPRGDVLVAVHAGAAGRDAPVARHAGHLGEHQTRRRRARALPRWTR